MERVFLQAYFYMAGRSLEGLRRFCGMQSMTGKPAMGAPSLGLPLLNHTGSQLNCLVSPRLPTVSVVLRSTGCFFICSVTFHFITQNWDAKTVYKLIDLKASATEPPVLRHKTDDEIRSFIEEPYLPPNYECISQWVERAVKDTSEAAQSVSGRDRQDGLTLNKRANREKVPSLRKAYYPEEK